jgi:transcriptional regulator with XRE-family HTH domain
MQSVRLERRGQKDLKLDLSHHQVVLDVGMPRRRYVPLMERLGARIRARREFVCRDLGYVAKEIEISKQQLSRYELGLSQPPVGVLHRIAGCLGTTMSDLAGEGRNTEMQEQFDTMIRIYNDPFIGGVTRHMQDMPVQQRRDVLAFVTNLAGAQVETVKVMK